MKISVSYRLEKRRKMNKSTISKKSQTDWERREAMEEDDIDLSDMPKLTATSLYGGQRKTEKIFWSASAAIKSLGVGYPGRAQQFV
jgi:hypothetical protein